MSYPTQGPQVSQVSLPCDSHGAIDFGNYPFRVSVTSKLMFRLYLCSFSFFWNYL